MPSTTTTKHKGFTLTFTEADHKYVDDRNMEYDSVTTMLGHYHEEFDAVATSERMEAQGKGKAENLRAGWDQIRDEATEYGTHVHEAIEQILSGGPITIKPQSDKEKSAMHRAWLYMTKTLMPSLDKVLKCEAVLFHPQWLIAGTADLIAREPDGTILIGDHKTNADIHKQPFQGRMMFDPVSHLPDCALSHYTLQLNIYQAMIVSAGYLPRTTKFKRSLFWIPHHSGDVERIDLPDMQREAYELILDWVHARVPF